MIQSRKGLSDIVTNVLIILLVLVAIGIIWAFVRPTINQGAGQLQGSNECLTIDLSAVSCTYHSVSHTADLTYKRTTGDGTIQEVKFILKDASGNSKVIGTSLAADIPAVLETRSKTAADFTGFAPAANSQVTFDTAVVVQIPSNPAGRTCAPREAPVVCTVQAN